MVVIGIKENLFLLAMGEVIANINIENNLLWNLGGELYKLLDKERFHCSRVDGKAHIAMIEGLGVTMRGLAQDG